MSKWGKQYADSILPRLKDIGGKNLFANMIEEMSQDILDLEEIIKNVQFEIVESKELLVAAKMKESSALAAEAHMRGYIKRVHELDPEGTHPHTTTAIGEDSDNTTSRRTANKIRRPGRIDYRDD